MRRFDNAIREQLEQEKDYRMIYLLNVVKARGYSTIYELSKAMNIHDRALFDYFQKGIDGVNVEVLITFCKFLKISPDFIMGNFNSKFLPKQFKDMLSSNKEIVEQSFIEKERELLKCELMLLNRELAVNEKEVKVVNEEKERIKMRMGELRVLEGKY